MKRFLVSFIALLAFGAALFVSCEIGLGSSVDTQPPLVAVESPTADYIIKDAFVMQGTCSDEQGVQAISVSLKNTATKKSYSGYTGKIDSVKGTWTCTINPLSESKPIPDGTYEATVKATDFAGRTSVATKSFVIDNTAPLLVLTRPSTKISGDGEPEFDSYGAQFDITGQVADDSNIDRLVVSIYSDKECTAKIRDVELNNVPPTIDLTVAKKGDGIYEEIYGTETGTKEFYCTISIFDEARHCPAVENDSGNGRTVYYLYNDIYSELLKTYKITEIYHMLNGTYTGNARSLSTEETIEQVKSILEKAENKSQVGSFSLNPDNSPVYTLSGFDVVTGSSDNDKYEAISKEDSNYGLLNGSALTVKLSAGLDKSPLKKESLGLYLMPYEKVEGKEEWKVNENKKIWLIHPYKFSLDPNGKRVYSEEFDYDYEANYGTTDKSKAEVKTYFEDRRKAITTVGSYDFTATLNIAPDALCPLATGTCYAVGAVGIDENENPFVNSNKYGFILQSSGSAPVLAVTHIAADATKPGSANAKSSWYIKKGDGMHLWGTVTAEDKCTVTVTVKDNKNNDVKFESETISCKSSDHPAEEVWGPLEIPNKYFITTKNGEKVISADYTVTVSAIVGTRKVEKQIAVGYDVDGPNIEIASVLPLVSANGKDNNVNGKFTVKGRVTDEFYKLSETKKITLEVYKDFDEVKPVKLYSLQTTSSNFTQEIDSTTDLIDEDHPEETIDNVELTLVVTAYDYAGNKSTALQKVYLNQATDKPVVELTNATKEGYESTYPVDGTSNVFLAGAPITATISDDDGIESITVNVYEAEPVEKDPDDAESSEQEYEVKKTPFKEPEVINKSKITSNPYPLTYTVPTAIGTYVAEIIVQDDTENKTKNNTCKFFFMVDSGAPNIAINAGAGGKYYGKKSGPIEVTGTVNGLSGLVVYNSPIDENHLENGQISGVQPNALANSATWTDSFKVPSTVEESDKQPKEQIYYVRDKKGRIGKATLLYYVDNTAPTVEIGNESNLVESADLKLYGFATDPEGKAKDASGVNAVYYKLLSATAAEPVVEDTESKAATAGWTKLGGTTSWNFWQTFVEGKGPAEDSKEGKYTLYVCAYDVAQNVSDIAKYEFTVDLNKPVVETKYYIDSTPGTEIEIGASSQAVVEKPYTFVYTASDTYGLHKTNPVTVEIKKDGVKLTSGYTNTYENGEGKITFTSQEDGTYEYVITAKDENNKTTSVTRTIILDTTAPKIEITLPTSDDEWSTAKTVTVKGTADDASGVYAVYYTTADSPETPSSNAKDASSWTGKGWKKCSGTSTSWNTKLSNLSTGTTTISIAAVDIYGTVSAITTRKVNYDGEAPSLSSVKYSVNGGEGKAVSDGDSVVLANNKISLAGKASDNYSLKSVTVSGVNGNNSAVELYKYEAASDTTEATKNWFTEDLSAKLADGKWKFTVTVEDASGQSVSQNYTFTIDTQKPVITDGKLYGAVVSAAYKTAEKGLVSVTVTDAGVSGIEEVQYLVDSASLDESALKAKEFTGTLSKSDTTYSKQVTFSQGKNYVYVKATDGAGNETYYGAGGSFYCNVDSEVPVVAFVAPVSGSTITDKDDLVVTLNVSDATSKFTSTSKATVKLFHPTESGWEASAAATKSVSTGVNGGEVSVTFEKTLLTKSSMKFTVEVTDAAGLSNAETYSTVTLDNVAPTLKVNNPVESASVTAINGKIKLNGTSYDAVEVDYVKLYRSKVSGDDSENNITLSASDFASGDSGYAGTYILMQEYTGSDKYNWSFADFDTTAFDDGTEIKFYVVSADKAGNKSYVVRSTKVDQDADRPVITFSNVTLASGMSATARILHQQDTVYGTVTDDDGVTSVKVSADGSNWTEVYSNGAWEYKLSSTDGEQTLWFKVTDSEGTTFVSGASENLGAPKLSDKTTTLTAKEKSKLYLVVDRSKPEIVSTKWIDSESKETVLNAGGKLVTNKNFSLAGSVKDGYLVSSVKLTGKKNGGSVEVLFSKTDINASEYNWNQSFVTGSETASDGEKKLADGTWELTLVVTDKAGKTSDSVIYTAVVDTTAPVIGTHTLTSSVGTVSTDGVWHESATPSLKVTASDETSGVKGVYYLASNTKFTLDELKTQVIDGTVGLSGTEYSKNLSLNEGVNYIYVKVLDEADNAAYYGANGIFAWSVDATGPKIQINSPSGADYLNKNNAYSFDISVSDALNNLVSSSGSVLGKVKASVKVYNSDKTKDVELTPTVEVDTENPAMLKITGTIPTATWATITTDTVIFAVTVCDDVENLTTSDGLSLAFDNTPPSVEIKNPAGKLNASNQLPVNGTISITGVAGDNKGLASVKLYRTALSTEAASAVSVTGTYAGKYILLKEYDGTDAYNWTLDNFDTTEFTDGSVITLYALAEDTAQNKTETAKVLLIDQDADRPEIKITNANLAGMTSAAPVWHKQSTIYGTVTDDDGVSSLKIATAAEYAKIKSDEKTWADITECLDSGEWKYTFSNEGENTLYFYVKDTSGTSGREFVSNLGNDTAGNKLLESPKIIDGSKKTFGYKDSDSKDTGLYLKVSTKVPSIEEIYFRTDDKSALADWGTSNPSENGWLSSSQITAKTFGGPSSSLYVMIKASDANGIASTSATLASVSGTSKYVSSEKTIGVFQLDTSAKALDGNQKLVLTATGTSTNDYSRDFTISIDNTAPVIKFSSHTSGMTVFGSQENTIMGTATEAIELYYQVTKADASPSVTGSGWTDITNYVSPISWLLAFDGKTGSNAIGGNTYHDEKQLNAYLELLGYDISSDDAPAQNVYIWLYAKDSLGNVSDATALQLIVNPKGDKPTVNITAPVSGEKVGGSIRIGGETSIVVNQVDKVWIQVLPNYTEGMSWDNWESEFNTLISGKTVAYSVGAIEYGGTEKGRGILAGGSPSNWYITLNNSDELNGDGSEEITYGVRAYALSSSGKVSEPYISTFTLDPNSPVISDLALVQYDDAGNISRSLAYEAGMWISGEWTLTGHISDDSGIKLVTVDGKESSDIENYGAVKPSGYYNKTLKVPVKGSGDFGVIDFQIVAYEGKSENALTGKASININFDNKVPDFTTDLANGAQIVQSDGTYKLSGTLVEESSDDKNQSGFGQVAFYFTRTVGGNTYYIDPMIQSGSARKSNRIDVSTLTLADGLYYKTGTISSVNSKEITLSDAPDSTYVRVGGLCKIMDSFYVIKAISGSVITLNSAIDDSAKDKTVYFAMAQVADNTVTENGTTTYYGGGSSISNDDGDQMVESVSVTGYTAKWNAYLNSLNIPDGTVDVHFVGFDKAGNHTAKTVTGCEVVNNRPRLAGVKLATDINGSDTLEESEKINVYSGIYNASSSNKKTGVTVNGRKANGEGVHELQIPEGLGEAVMTIKGLTQIIPEVVGGNEGLGYSYSLNGKSIGYKELNSTHGDGGANTIRGDSETTIQLTLKDLLDSEIPDGTNETLDLKIWDKTEGKTAGTDSQWARVQIQVNVAIQDTTSPEVSISPFYWNSSSDNSLYKNSKNNGHIELPADLDFTGSVFTADSGLFDKDPKVSGKIVFRGTATDNTQLKNISVKIPGFNGGNAFEIATYDAANQKWTDGTNAVCRVNASTGAVTWTSDDADQTETNLAANGWSSKVVSSEFTVSGHAVSFELYWNSAKISGVAATDVNVIASATDRGSATVSGDTVSYTSNAAGNSSNFRIDVVPYIFALKTTNRAKSGLKDSNIRSASGKYSVIKGSDANFITVQGFNLNPTAARIVSSSAVTGTVTVTATSGTALTVGTKDTTNYTSVGLTNNGTKSGYLELFVNGIRTLNNINNNDSAGDFALKSEVRDYENMPNREADYYDTKNVLLNDDRYIRFFDMKNTGMKNGYYPTMIMNGDNPVFGYVNKSGGTSGTPTSKGTDTFAGTYQPSHAMPQRSEWNGSNATKVYTEYLIKASTWDQMGMAVDEDGRYYNVSVYNRDEAAMSLVYDRYAELYTASTYKYTSNGKNYTFESNAGAGWGAGTGYSTYANSGYGCWSYETGNNAITLDSVNYGSLQTERYQYPKLIVKGKSNTNNTAASVYMAYYDDVTKEICFRNFQLGKTVSGTPSNLDSTHTDQNGTTYTQKINFTENTSNYKSGAAAGRLSVTNDGSQYYSMAVTSDNHVIIVWYSNADSKLKMKYSTNAVTGTNPTNAVAWTESPVNFPQYVGNYVSMALDSSNGIHIAAFDANDSDLKYMYLPSYDSTSLSTMTVDQSGSVGNWTQIKVDTKNTTNPYYNKPVIAYYNSTETGGRDSIKLAYANKTAGNINAGVDSDNYTTGEWEYMTVPAITPPQGGDPKFQNVCLDFDSTGRPVVGYLGTNLEFGKALDE